MADFGIQETVRDVNPTTDSCRPECARIEIIHQCRQAVDFDKVGQSNARPNASRFYLENGFGTSIMIQFILAIKDVNTNEYWNHTIKNKQRNLVVDNERFVINVEISPNGLVCFPPTDHQQNQLPNNMANVKCVLPIESDDEPIRYRIDINLYQNNRTYGCMSAKTLLHFVRKDILTHERGHDLYEYQEGRNITLVESPIPKIKLTGILAEDIGKKIKKYFQNMVDNGLYQQFYAEQQKVVDFLSFLSDTKGKNYKDLELFIALEESILLFGQDKMAECENKCLSIIERIMENNTPNSVFLLAKAYYIISAIYRQRDEPEKARQNIIKSTELLESVEVCEETAVNQYNWAAYFAEKGAKNPLSQPEKKEAEFRFNNALLHWDHQKDNDTIRCAVRLQIRKLNFLLKTSRQNFPDISEPVCEEDLAKAYRAIEHVQHNFLPKCSKRHKVTFHIAKADFYIRKALMFGPLYPTEARKAHAVEALKILKGNLKVAMDISLDKEIEGINKRMGMLNNMLHTNWFDSRGECLPHSSRAIVRDSQLSSNSIPVEQEWNCIDSLLERLVLHSQETDV